MKKFYNEPEMAVKIFEAENIVTASEGTQVESLDTNTYSVINGTVSTKGTKLELIF